MKINKKEILKNIPDKIQNSWTTSLKFKEDLIDFCDDKFLNKTVLEIGTFHGHTTRILSYLFKNVLTIDNNPQFMDEAVKLNTDRNNIEYLLGDIYDYQDLPAFDNFKNQKVDVVFIDAVHKYRYVIVDTINSLKAFKDIHLIYDDYGAVPQVKRAIDDCLELGIIELVGYLGHEEGLDIKKDGKNQMLKGREGIICKSRNLK